MFETKGIYKSHQVCRHPSITVRWQKPKSRKYGV
ncbi:hypothetical protein Gotur_022386 [Gossypium turneri]